MIKNRICPVCRQPIVRGSMARERERAHFKINCLACRRAYQGPRRNRRFRSRTYRERMSSQVRPRRSKRRGLGSRTINRRTMIDESNPRRMDPKTLQWLEKRSMENLIITFRKEILEISNGASPDGLLPTGPRRRLIDCGVFRLVEGRARDSCAGRTLKLTRMGKKLLAAMEEELHD